MFNKSYVWGTNGRKSLLDRQELQFIFVKVRGFKSIKQKLECPLHYRPDRTGPVLLRGEEYSAQIDHFVKAITSGNIENTSARLLHNRRGFSNLSHYGGRRTKNCNFAGRYYLQTAAIEFMGCHSASKEIYELWCVESRD